MTPSTKKPIGQANRFLAQVNFNYLQLQVAAITTKKLFTCRTADQAANSYNCQHSP